MRNTGFVAVWLLGLVLGGCAYSIFAEGDRLQLSLPEGEGWELGFQQYNPTAGTGGMTIDEYVLPGETVQEWSELVTVMWTYRDLTVSPREAYQQLVEIRERNCPGSTRWNVLEEADNALLYEWWAKPCMGFADQHEIALIIDGRRDRFFVRYTNMQPAMDASKRAQWVGILAATTVMIEGEETATP